ncbi:MAG: hypothetical protein ACMXX8_02900 [Candidatus Woesearchaeota archaeon]
MSISGRGYVSDDYTKFIEFEIGSINIFSDPYYGTVQVDEQNLSEEEIEILIEEVEKRLVEFEKKVKSIRDKASSEVFDKPIKKWR